MNFLVNNWLLILIALASGGMLLWPMIASARGGSLSVTDAVQLINREKGVLVDVSDAEEYAKAHARGAKNVPLADMETRLQSVVKNKAVPLILFCSNGARASRALATAKKLGYQQPQTLSGGLKAWREANLPVEGVV